MISTIWAPTPRITMLPVAEYVPISRSKPAPIYLSEILIVPHINVLGIFKRANIVTIIFIVRVVWIFHLARVSFDYYFPIKILKMVPGIERSIANNLWSNVLRMAKRQIWRWGKCIESYWKHCHGMNYNHYSVISLSLLCVKKLLQVQLFSFPLRFYLSVYVRL